MWQCTFQVPVKRDTDQDETEERERRLDLRLDLVRTNHFENSCSIRALLSVQAYRSRGEQRTTRARVGGAGGEARGRAAEEQLLVQILHGSAL